MFRRKLLTSVFTLGLFVGACDLTTLYQGVTEPFMFDVLELGKMPSPLLGKDEPGEEKPPGGTNDPPERS